MSDLFAFTPEQLARQKKLASLKRRGHAAQPGTGPVGETCKTCQHYTLRHMSGTYRKCGLANWTRGPGSDIRASDPACEKWAAEGADRG